MYSIENKSEESRAIQNNAEKHIPTAQFKDNRSQNETEKNTTAQLEKKENLTGMPDDLKEGIESLSGFSMDDVRVHYNSSKPATVQALAYTQGTDIHVAPGQEKHLPHEAWHVAQQMAGRVSPTTNINGMPVNDNAELEHEADLMGEKAVQCKEMSICRNNLILCKKASLDKLNAVQRFVAHFAPDDGPIVDLDINTFGMLKNFITQPNLDSWWYDNGDIYYKDLIEIVSSFQNFIPDDSVLPEFKKKEQFIRDLGSLKHVIKKKSSCYDLHYLDRNNEMNVFFVEVGKFNSPTVKLEQEQKNSADTCIQNNSFSERTGDWRLDSQPNKINAGPFIFLNLQMQLNGSFPKGSKTSFATVLVRENHSYPYGMLKACIRYSYVTGETVVMGTEEEIDAFLSTRTS